MKALLFVAIGGCLGALARWGLASKIDQVRGLNASFPLGIFAANIIGCFAFGLIYALGENREWLTIHMRLALFTGFLGSFTTFSTFSWNTMDLLKNGQIGMAMLNIVLSVALGLLAVWIGYSLGKD